MSEKKDAEPQEVAAPKPAAKGDHPHRVKITQMTLEQVEAALENANKTMGGLHSHYAQALLARKEILKGGSPRPTRLKAA